MPTSERCRCLIFIVREDSIQQPRVYVFTCVRVLLQHSWSVFDRVNRHGVNSIPAGGIQNSSNVPFVVLMKVAFRIVTFRILPTHNMSL